MQEQTLCRGKTKTAMPAQGRNLFINPQPHKGLHKIKQLWKDDYQLQV